MTARSARPAPPAADAAPPAADAAPADVATLLLADPSPALRYRVLTELLDIPADDPEAADLARRSRAGPEVQDLLTGGDGDLKSLAWRLCRLAWLGIDREEPRVAEIAERIFERQGGDGAFPLTAYNRGERESRYSMVPLQVSLPLRGLAAAGYATDPRAERAYEWLLGQRLEDGAWPLGLAAGQPGYIAGYRKLPGSKGCRVNTEAAIACLVLHPERRSSAATRRALDLLLQRETREEWSLGSEVARLVGAEPPTGFVTFYARFDLAFVLDLASRTGASAEDPRIADLVAFIVGLRGAHGLWEHPTRPQLGRWLTFDLLASLRRLATGDWTGTAPRIPFRAYPRGGSTSPG
jgi:hypothetical protein